MTDDAAEEVRRYFDRIKIWYVYEKCPELGREMCCVEARDWCARNVLVEESSVERPVASGCSLERAAADRRHCGELMQVCCCADVLEARGCDVAN